MMAEIIEGKWEDLVGRRDLQGREVRVLVFEEGEKGKDDPWLKSLRAWVDSHQPLAHGVNDSRESIYVGTIDDPR
jgi:hypothetical protein